MSSKSTSSRTYAAVAKTPSPVISVTRKRVSSPISGSVHKRIARSRSFEHVNLSESESDYDDEHPPLPAPSSPVRVPLPSGTFRSRRLIRRDSDYSDASLYFSAESDFQESASADGNVSVYTTDNVGFNDGFENESIGGEDSDSSTLTNTTSVSRLVNRRMNEHNRRDSALHQAGIAAYFQPVSQSRPVSGSGSEPVVTPSTSGTSLSVSSAPNDSSSGSYSHESRAESAAPATASYTTSFPRFASRTASAAPASSFGSDIPSSRFAQHNFDVDDEFDLDNLDIITGRSRDPVYP
ncbi:hypothetical protein BD408DRAFT_438597, partial [Parasitella parasitica]